MTYIERGQDIEVMLLCGGGHPAGEAYADGYYAEPTVFIDVTMDLPIAREEIFGPILSVIRWLDEEDVVAQANDVPYGLTGSIFPDDVRRAYTVAERLEAGYVWINTAASHYWGTPFGGRKQYTVRMLLISEAITAPISKGDPTDPFPRSSRSNSMMPFYYRMGIRHAVGGIEVHPEIVEGNESVVGVSAAQQVVDTPRSPVTL